MLYIEHIELKAANSFVAAHHRHHKPVTGHRFSIACLDNGRLCGVAIIGRPVARAINQYDTVEVLRLCTDGTRNACSKLYSSAARAARTLGYKRIITYILDNENGASLRASGWKECYTTSGGTWACPSRTRKDDHPTCPKKLYDCVLTTWGGGYSY